MELLMDIGGGTRISIDNLQVLEIVMDIDACKGASTIGLQIPDIFQERHGSRLVKADRVTLNASVAKAGAEAPHRDGPKTATPTTKAILRRTKSFDAKKSRGKNS